MGAVCIGGEPICHAKSLVKPYVVGEMAVPVPVELGAVEVGEFVAVVCALMLNIPLVEYMSLTLLYGRAARDR